MQIPYDIVNSFTVTDPITGKQVGGNGAAVIFAESKDQFTDEAQIEIAKSFPRLAEAVFVYPCKADERAGFGMRYWSPQRLCEYAITGHPTIAAACAMVLRKHKCLQDGKRDYVLETKAGLVPLSIDQKEAKVYMGQIQPLFQDIPPETAATIPSLFGLQEGDIVSPIKAVNMGLGYFIFEVKDTEKLMRMGRDLPALIEANKKFGLNGGAQPYALLKDGAYDLRTRNLDLRAPNAEGVWLEDSACGQGCASLMAYLMKYRGHDGRAVRMQQGVLSEPCCVEAFGKKSGDRLDIFIGGTALTKESGVLSLEGNRISRGRTASPSGICSLT